MKMLHEDIVYTRALGCEYCIYQQPANTKDKLFSLFQQEQSSLLRVLVVISVMEWQRPTCFVSASWFWQDKLLLQQFGPKTCRLSKPTKQDRIASLPCQSENNQCHFLRIIPAIYGWLYPAYCKRERNTVLHVGLSEILKRSYSQPTHM